MVSVYRNINSTSNLHPPALKLSPVHILFNCLLHDLTVFNFTPKKNDQNTRTTKHQSRMVQKQH